MVLVSPAPVSMVLDVIASAWYYLKHKRNAVPASRDDAAGDVCFIAPDAACTSSRYLCHAFVVAANTTTPVPLMPLAIRRHASSWACASPALASTACSVQPSLMPAVTLPDG